MKFAYLIEPPFNFVDTEGRVQGHDVEIARHVMAALGEAFEPVETSFGELLPGLADGRWRMTTGLFATTERQVFACFSRPIWALADGLLLRRGNPLRLTGYRAVAQHPRCRLAVIRDQFQHRTAVEFGMPETRLSIFETYEEAAQAVLDGRADAYASVARAHEGYLAAKAALLLDCLTVPTQEKPPAFGAFAFALCDSPLRDRVNAILTDYLGSAAHRAMAASHGFSDAEVDLLNAEEGNANWVQPG